MNIERLYRIHEMIESETTGTPAEFAQRFDIKERQLYYLIEELTLFGAKVGYSRRRKNKMLKISNIAIFKEKNERKSNYFLLSAIFIALKLLIFAII